MEAPLVLVTGFGPFPGVDRNPSGDVARALEERPPAGVEVRARVLPTSFRRAPAALAEFVGADDAWRVRLLLALGVHRGEGFRIERTARLALDGRARLDADGVVAAQVGREEPARATPLDLEALVGAMGAAAEWFWISEDAGGYVCEWTYAAVLREAEIRSAPGLLVHVPHVRFTPVPQQAKLLGELVAATLRSGAAGTPDPRG